jgi:hypothetical protein
MKRISILAVCPAVVFFVHGCSSLDDGTNLTGKKTKKSEGKCLIAKRSGDNLFKDTVDLDKCKSKCAEFAKTNEFRTCEFDGKSITSSDSTSSSGPSGGDVTPSKRTMPSPDVKKAHFDAEQMPYIESNGEIISSDFLHKGSHRKYSGSVENGQPDSPFWTRISNPVYHGGFSYKVVSQVGNGRNEQRILRDFTPRTDGARWFSFAVNIDPSTSPGTSHFFFAQLHQNVEFNPPLFMSWTGTSWELTVRTDNGVKGANIRTRLAYGPMAKGRWYEFKMKMKPEVHGGAELAIWQKENGAWVSKTLDWGGSPKNSFGYHLNVDGSANSFSDFNFKAGIYRGSMSTIATVYIDKLRYGLTEGYLE